MALRRTAAALAVAVLAVTAGCGFLFGTEELAFEASPATVGEDALSETGYEQTEMADQEVTRTFEAAGQQRNVSVTNRLAQYEKQVDLGPLGSKRAAVFVTFASPEVSVLGQEFNPIADMSSRDFLDRFESQYEGIDVGEKTGSREVEMLDTTATVERYEGTATMDGTELEVSIHVTDVVSHGDDYVVALGIHPQRLDGEADNVDTLLEGTEHDSGE